MHINRFGQLVQTTWQELPSHFPSVVLDEFIVMPNHVHGILLILPEEKTTGTACRAPTPDIPCIERFSHPLKRSLSTILRSFKSATTKNVNLLHHTPGAPFWQRNYYERIIRDERELEQKRSYIRDNPGQWATDEENREALTSRHK